MTTYAAKMLNMSNYSIVIVILFSQTDNFLILSHNHNLIKLKLSQMLQLHYWKTENVLLLYTI